MFDKRFKSHHDAEAQYQSFLPSKRSSLEQLSTFLNMGIDDYKRSCIYVHIPYCDKICSFCNLNRQKKDDTLEIYTQDLIKQIEWMGEHKYFDNHPIEALYFGGGTPTILSASQMKRVLQALQHSFQYADDIEISVETTLHNLSDKHLELFDEMGVNRISIGIQTFQSEGRKFFHRSLQKEQVVEKMKDLRQRFHGVISIDKIYNYPGENEAMLLDDVRLIAKLGIDSVSFYSLMIHQGSKLSQSIKEEMLNTTSDKSFHDLFIKEMSKYGYEVLELTKMAKIERDNYRYMEIRNQDGNTIPLGNGAGGQIAHFKMYAMDFKRIMVVENIGKDYEIANKIYGLFQYPLVNCQQLAKYGLQKDGVYSKAIENLLKKGYLFEKDGNLQMSEKGLFYGNNIGGLLTKEFLENPNRD